jgi:hypothetical protein
MKLRIFMVLSVALSAEMSAAQGPVCHYHPQPIVVAVPQEPVRREQSESDIRETIYWLEKNNPVFYKKESFQKNLNYYIAIFANDIKVVEEKIAQNKALEGISLFKKENLAGRSFRGGLVATGFLAASIIGVCIGLKNIGKSDIALLAVPGAMISALSTIVVADSFDTAFHYEERLVERLERNKRILALLETEKAARQATIQNSIITEEAAAKILEAVIKPVIEAVEGFFKPKKA